jgi:hypothetical protein
MYIPLHPEFFETAIFRCPVKWFGNVAPDGDALPWMQAPLGSEYTRITAASVNLYVKKEANSADADWKAVTTS